MKSFVCKTYCHFYKPDKAADEKCGGIAFLERHLTKRELKNIVTFSSKTESLSNDDAIKKLVCENACDYYATGDCDYRLGQSSPPCGGYNIINTLLGTSHQG